MRENQMTADAPKQALVTGIIVNHNGADYLREAVVSLLEQEGVSLDVVVVDNGSTDGSDVAVEAELGARVEVVRLGANRGFGAGNNAAIRRSSSKYVLLLNNDAVAVAGFAAELVRMAEDDPRIGMVAPKVLDHVTHSVIDTVGHLLYPDGLNRGRGRLERDAGQYDACQEALFPSGAAALYRRTMLDEIGLFDEAYFLYGEDADLGLRGRLAGWRCALAPRAVAYHRYSCTAGAYSTLKAYYVERNRVWVLARTFPWWLIILSPAFTLVRLACQAWGAVTGRGAAGRLVREQSFLAGIGVAVRATISGFGGLPRILRLRRGDRSFRRLGGLEFLRLLRTYRLPLRDVAFKE